MQDFVADKHLKRPRPTVQERYGVLLVVVQVQCAGEDDVHLGDPARPVLVADGVDAGFTVDTNPNNGQLVVLDVVGGRAEAAAREELSGEGGTGANKDVERWAQLKIEDAGGGCAGMSVWVEKLVLFILARAIPQYEEDDDET